MVEIIQETSNAKQSKLTEEKQKVTSENKKIKRKGGNEDQRER
jgi:hypothetical protein